MIWVAWRQHRLELLLMGAVLVICVTFLLITGLNIAHTFHQLGLDACLAHPDSNACSAPEVDFANQYNNLTVVPELIAILLTVLFGMFVGAPLIARELEQGTHRLVWTQGITRARWLSVKVALTLGAGILLFSLLFVLLFWLYAPLYQFLGSSRFPSPGFDAMGPVLPASAILALAVGIFAGVLTRRTVLAMLLTLALILAIRLPVENILRPNYQPAITVIQPLGPNLEEQPIPGAGKWIFDVGMLDPHGNKTNQASCQTASSCGYSMYYTYQPVNRYWPFQWIETGIYLAFSVLALALATWLVKRRIV